MAHGRKTGGRDIKKGQVLNPRGGKAHDPVVRAIRKMTHNEIAEIGSMIIEGNLQDLTDLMENRRPDSSVLKVWMASIAVRAINRGDADALNKLLDRIVGRVRQDIGFLTPAGAMAAVVTMNDDDLREEADRLAREVIDAEFTVADQT